MAGVGGDLDGGRELSEIEQKDPSMGRIFRRVIQAVNTLATNTSSSATGEVKAPKPPDSVKASVSGEYLHIAISHGGQLQRGVQYFTEISPNDASFKQPIVYHHGASRTPPPISLPTGTANPSYDNSKPISPTNPLVIPTNYYVRSYAQYPSSQPSSPTVLGGSSAPVPINMSGLAVNESGSVTQYTTNNLLPSTGSGTASNTGQQGSWGLGKTQQRS